MDKLLLCGLLEAEEVSGCPPPRDPLPALGMGGSALTAPSGPGREGDEGAGSLWGCGMPVGWH